MLKEEQKSGKEAEEERQEQEEEETLTGASRQSPSVSAPPGFRDPFRNTQKVGRRASPASDHRSASRSIRRRASVGPHGEEDGIGEAIHRRSVPEEGGVRRVRSIDVGDQFPSRTPEVHRTEQVLYGPV